MNVTDPDNEDNLMDSFRRGEISAFRAIHDHLAPTIFYFVEHIVTDTQEAENIVSSTFEKVWFMRHRFEKLSELKAFLYTASRNASYDYLRYIASLRAKQVLSSELEKLEVADEITEGDADMEMLKAQLLSEIKQQIELLPENKRSIMKLLMKGMKVKDVAKQLNISEGTVKMNKSRALEVIRKNLKTGRWLLVSFLIFK